MDSTTKRYKVTVRRMCKMSGYYILTDELKLRHPPSAISLHSSSGKLPINSYRAWGGSIFLATNVGLWRML